MKRKPLLLMTTAMVFSLLMSCDAMIPTNDPYNQGSSYPSPGPASIGENFSGNYTNQGDPNRASTFTLNLSQSGNHISGTARNSTGDGDDSGLLSVDGYIDGDVANIQFFDQRGNMIANGVLSHNDGAYSFIQNSSSTIIPAESYLYRGR